MVITDKLKVILDEQFCAYRIEDSIRFDKNWDSKGVFEERYRDAISGFSDFTGLVSNKRLAKIDIVSVDIRREVMFTDAAGHGIGATFA